jgi:hypothetical protein
MIHHRLAEQEKARDYLQRALATNPYFHIVHAETAERTLKAIEAQRPVAALQEQSDDH